MTSEDEQIPFGVALTLVEAYFKDELAAAAGRALAVVSAQTAIIGCWLLAMNVVLTADEYLEATEDVPYVGSRMAEIVLMAPPAVAVNGSRRDRLRFKERYAAFHEFGTLVHFHGKVHEQGDRSRAVVDFTRLRKRRPAPYLAGATEFTSNIIMLEAQYRQTTRESVLDDYRRAHAFSMAEVGE